MKEIVFEVAQEADGGFTAEAIGESIFTQADSWGEAARQCEGGGASLLFRLRPARVDPPAPGAR